MRTFICFLLLIAALWLASPVRAGEEATARGVVKSIYDGDTLTVSLASMPSCLGEKISLCVLGIDTPEMRDKCPKIKPLAVQARELVRQMRPIGSEVFPNDIAPGRYFRIVARVQCAGGDPGEVLLDAGLVHPYDGQGARRW